ncbi:MAG: polyprenyl synthetase family protein, partial [Erysipelotrichales bacterium]|nr:polyprenyl synthetase family protein [Erysipelotrichales bacterium]
AGDALLTEAFYLIGNTSLSDSIKVRLMMLLSEYSGIRGMIKGQEIDMYHTTEENIMEMDELKTGCLLSLPMMMAAVIAGAEEDVEKWESVGKKFGLIFQIQDDILDVIGNSEELGKMVNSDSKNDKVTYMKLFGLDKCKEIIADTYKEIDNIRNLFTNNFNELFEYLKELDKRRN